MPRSAGQNAIIRDEARRQLLEAATAVFTRMGFAATRMSDIAAEAGVSHGLTYRYFPNKDAIYVAVVEIAMEGADQLIAAAVDRPEPAIARLREICQGMLEGARESPAFVLIMLQAASSGAIPEQARATLRRSSSSVESRLAALIAEAQAAGEAGGGDPGVIARALVSTVCGLSAVTSIGAAVPPLDISILMRLLSPT
jgi:AcrR family transcriptional regulator